MSSSIMINDNLTMDNINPYVNTPGNRYNGGSYVPKLPYSPPPVENKPEWENEEKSIGCQLTRSAGTGTASYCTPKTDKCPLDRPLLPQQRVDPGILNYIAMGCFKVQEIIKKQRNINIVCILFLCLIVYRSR